MNGGVRCVRNEDRRAENALRLNARRPPNLSRYLLKMLGSFAGLTCGRDRPGPCHNGIPKNRPLRGRAAALAAEPSELKRSSGDALVSFAHPAIARRPPNLSRYLLKMLGSFAGLTCGRDRPGPCHNGIPKNRPLRGRAAALAAEPSELKRSSGDALVSFAHPAIARQPQNSARGLTHPANE